MCSLFIKLIVVSKYRINILLIFVILIFEFYIEIVIHKVFYFLTINLYLLQLITIIIYFNCLSSKFFSSGLQFLIIMIIEFFNKNQSHYDL